MRTNGLPYEVIGKIRSRDALRKRKPFDRNNLKFTNRDHELCVCALKIN